MNAEHLFQAIGDMESSRLVESEMRSKKPPLSLTKEEPEMKKKKSTRVIRNLLIAAVLASLLAVTAMAVGNSFGLRDYLSELGLKDTEAVEKLSVVPTEAPGTAFGQMTDREQDAPDNGDEGVSFWNHFAKYTVLEAVLDRNSLYVSVKISPLDSDTILVPDIAFDEDVVTADGKTLTDLRNGEDAAKLIYAGVRLDNSDGSVEGLGYTFKSDDEGNLYYYVSGQNTYEGTELSIHCTGLAHTEDMPLAERVEFDVTLSNNSTESIKYEAEITDPGKVYEETGIRMGKIGCEETELGVYISISYSVADSQYEYLSMWLVGPDGKELLRLPGVSFQAEQLSDGSYNQTLAYQKLESTEGVQLVIKDVWGDTCFGPYSVNFR
ncbi:MAG: hypothetical protein MR763_04960 [Clostridiales bacterium]|nr:hypothetical protein [Clostridiales bacterium]